MAYDFRNKNVQPVGWSSLGWGHIAYTAAGLCSVRPQEITEGGSKWAIGLLSPEDNGPPDLCWGESDSAGLSEAPSRSSAVDFTGGVLGLWVLEQTALAKTRGAQTVGPRNTQERRPEEGPPGVGRDIYGSC